MLRFNMKIYIYFVIHRSHCYLCRTFLHPNDVQTFSSLSTTIIDVNLLRYPIKALMLGMKCVFKHQDLQMFGLKLNNINPLEVVGWGSEKLLQVCGGFKLDNLALKPFKPSRCIKASFYFPENRLNFPITKGFRMIFFIKLVYQYIAIIFSFSTTSNHLHPLQVENCDSNSLLVVDEDDNVNLSLKGLTLLIG